MLSWLTLISPRRGRSMSRMTVMTIAISRANHQRRGLESPNMRLDITRAASAFAAPQAKAHLDDEEEKGE